jgi:PKD repeat protein
VTFTDTSTSVTGCAIDNWFWKSTSSDGTVNWTSTNQDPGSHTYITADTYLVELSVGNAAGFHDSTGAVQILVKP